MLKSSKGQFSAFASYIRVLITNHEQILLREDFPSGTSCKTGTLVRFSQFKQADSMRCSKAQLHVLKMLIDHCPDCKTDVEFIFKKQKQTDFSF